ncbi:MAG: SPOR domain-containing protein [Burkholderiales bacterium]|nr:SPOR domain-containing protein [Burkholderiales bacterium]
MLRFLFWSLLILNAMLLSLNLGWLGKWSLDEREPLRMKAEKRADKLTVLSASATQDLVDAAAAKAVPPIACFEFAGLNLADSQQLEEKLKPLAMGARQTRSEIAEVATNMVYLPPLANQDAADKKVALIKKMGMTDVYVVQDQSPLRWAISLGVFKTPEAAKNYLASVQKKGLKEAKIAPRAVSASKFVLRFSDVTVAEKKTLDQLQSQVPNMDAHECKSSDAAPKSP